MREGVGRRAWRKDTWNVYLFMYLRVFIFYEYRNFHPQQKLFTTNYFLNINTVKYIATIDKQKTFKLHVIYSLH